MSNPFLIASAVKLLDEFHSIAPNRDTRSDGWIGDAAHQQETSDHNPDETGKVPIHDLDKLNEVHAVDVDNNLNQSDLTMEKVVQYLLSRCRSGAEKRLRYIIYSRRIWEAKNSWTQKVYTGSSPHTEHAHFSFSYDTDKEASRASWHLEDIPVALSESDKVWIKAQIDGAATRVMNEVEAYVGDEVDRWTADGDNTVAKANPTDPNPQITVKSALYYIGATTAQIRATLRKMNEPTSGS
jgi:hypothetical protein